MDTDIVVITVVLNILFIGGGVAVILMAMYQRGKTREMQHRERLAMIERGLAPPPEREPAAFEPPVRRGYPPAIGIGIVIVALGLGLMMIIGLLGRAEDAALGVGGAIMVLGGAFLAIGLLQRRSQGPYSAYPVTPPRPPSPPGPPTPADRGGS